MTRRTSTRRRCSARRRSASARSRETGIRDATPEVYTWTVLARPVVLNLAGPADQSSEHPDIQNESPTATFTFASDQENSTFECQLIGEEATGTSWETCTSGKTYENLGFGEYTFEVRAIKNGITSFLAAQYEWEVADLTPPVVTFVARPAAEVDSREATFAITTNEPVELECSLDDAPFGVCTLPTTYTGLGLGDAHVRAPGDRRGRVREREPSAHAHVDGVRPHGAGSLIG